MVVPSKPDFVEVLYAVGLLRECIIQALECNLYRMCPLQRVCKNACWQKMIDGVVKSVTMLDFTDCPARRCRKTASELKLWLQNRIVPASIRRVDFGAFDVQFGFDFCAVFLECCNAVEFVKLRLDRSDFPIMMQHIVGMPRLVSLDIINVGKLQILESPIVERLFPVQHPLNFISVTTRDCTPTNLQKRSVIANIHRWLLRECLKQKYAHAEAENRTYFCINFDVMQELEILCLRCGILMFHGGGSPNPMQLFRCLELQKHCSRQVWTMN